MHTFMYGGAWALEPANAFVAPYTWLLVAMVVVTIGCAGLLSWHLLGGVSRQRITLDRVLDGSVSAVDLARAALANRVSHAAPSQERLAQLRAGRRVDMETARRTLWAADARFDYLWRCLIIVVSSTRHLIRLALIAAAFITAFGFFPSWEYFRFGDTASDDFPADLMALYRAGEDVLARLAAGLGVAGGLCVVSMVFDRLLQHRLASWKYLYATARDALSNGQPLE